MLQLEKTKSGVVGVLMLFCLSPLAMCAEITRDANEIIFMGSIGAGDDLKFSKLLDMGPVEHVVFNSKGGLLDPALAIATKIYDLKIPIRIRGICGSACASVILPSASSVCIEDGSFIAMHAGDPGMHRAAERLGKFESNELAEFRYAAAKLIARLDAFERRLDKPNFFKRIDEVTGFYDFDIDIKKDAAGEWVWRLSGQRYKQSEYWVPDAQSLRAVGIEVNQWRAPSRASISIALWRWPWNISFGN